ncbi:polymorphic toxin-type HINT domain-containing protein [Streptomyces hydrogenans]|uniref:polymorphic toxin-type HINT domain-containing protein n=1 Tax=Streptomyces hydrogenans TaxID=1873719 RepID=UPI0035DDE28E
MSSSIQGRPFHLPALRGKRTPRNAATRRARRRAGAAVSSLLVMALLPTNAWALPPTDPQSQGVVLPPLQRTPKAPADEAQIEKWSSWAGAPVEPPAEYVPVDDTPLAADTGATTLTATTSGLVQVEDLPVKIGKASPTAEDPTPPAPTGTWEVEVESRSTTEASALDGALITVTPPAAGSTPIDLELDYSKFADLFGTEWAGRLQIKQLPACFLQTPELPECNTAIDVPSVNDPATDTVRSTIDPADSPVQGLSTQAGGGPVALAVTDSGSGAAGNYKASPLSPSGTWSAGGSSGGFTWTYPLAVPAPPAGPAPKVAFTYSSQAVDGKTSVANGQASWIGDGWDYNPGFVERRYRSCSDDRKNSPNNDNATDKKKSDLCWASDNLVMSLAGNTTELVHDADGRWVPASDDGAKVEYLDKNGQPKAEQTGKYDSEYWRVTTRDGTRYYFGRNDLDGSAGTRALTKSAFTVPVVGNHTGEPCYQTTYASSFCTQAWRWNLDYVEDIHGNAMIIDWTPETNRYAKNGKTQQAETYTRGGYPTQILYGLRSDNLTGPPAGKVVFKVDQRCEKQGPTACSDSEFESKSYADKQPWWDTPANLHCKTGTTERCYVTAPTFWSRLRLKAVETYGQRTSGSTALSRVDTWTLQQSFPKQRTDTHPPLWLDSISRTGYGTTTDSKGNQNSEAAPAVSFIPNQVDMPNRVKTATNDPTPDFDRLRVETIRTETGGDIFIDYSAPCPAGTPTTKPENNTSRCYPVHWSPDPDLENPGLEWFNKYVVERVIEKDRATGQPDVVTTYDYTGVAGETGAAWAKDTDEFTKPELRTYNQWRGYARVSVTRGETYPGTSGEYDKAEQTKTTTRYFRGMSGDAGRPEITVKDSSNTVELGKDLLPYQGRVAETITYTSSAATATMHSRKFEKPYAKETAKRVRGDGLPDLKAYRTGTVSSQSIEHLNPTSARSVLIETAYDDTTGVPNPYGLPLTVHTTARDSDGTIADEQCTATEYVHNAAANLIGLPWHTRTATGPCATSEPAPERTIIESRTSYDALNSFGTKPTTGLPVQVDTVDGEGTGWVTSMRTVYDTLGRETKATDAVGNETNTTYTPSVGPAFKIATTNAAGHTTTNAYDPGRGTALTVTDPNNRTVTSSYDELGRVTDVWTASQNPATNKAAVKFAYQLADSKVPAVTTSTLRDNGTYDDTVTIYDGLLRPRQVQSEALGGGTLVTDTLYNPSGTVRETKNAYLAPGEPKAETFFPETVFEVPNSTKTSYDGLGRPTRVTTLKNDEPQHTTTSQYYGDRTLVRTAMKPDGSGPLSSSRAVKTWTDALGRTTKIQHYTTLPISDASSIVTTYAYDTRGKLAKVTDHKNNTWTYTYDTRGRVTASTDPDTGGATFGYNNLDQRIWSKDTLGHVQYTLYDNLGRTTETRDDSPTGPLVTRYTYDTLPGAKGQPVASIRYNNSKPYTSEVTGYDTEYRPTGTKITIPADTYTTGLARDYTYTYEYTPTGKLQAVNLPATPGGLAAEKVITRYSGEGAPLTTSGLTWYTAGTTYSPHGQILRTITGDAPRRLWTTNDYDQHTGRLNTTESLREATIPNAHISTLTYGYDTTGNITSLSDKQTNITNGTPVVATEQQCFTYDPMGRLINAWTGTTTCATSTTEGGARAPDATQVTPGINGSGYWQSYTFDEIGNRTSLTVRDPAGTKPAEKYTYDYGKTVPNNGTQSTLAQPHTLAAVNSTQNITGSTYTLRQSYTNDPAGNTTQRITAGGTTTKFTWDRRNKVTSADTDNNGTTDVTYLYDAGGNRLLEADATTRTLYLGDTEITVNTTGQATDAQRYYTHPGAPTTLRTTAGKTTDHKLTALLTDHHNTSTVAVEQTNNQTVTRRAFDPYGNPRGTEGNWPSRHTFLGVGIDDPVTNLAHIGAREYDPTTGRFISADPLIDLTDPLQMNGYTYANANPVTLSDPTGLRPDGAVGGAEYNDNWTFTQNNQWVSTDGQEGSGWFKDNQNGWSYRQNTPLGHLGLSTVIWSDAATRKTGKNVTEQIIVKSEKRKVTSDDWHRFLGVAGMLPRVGPWASLINGALYMSDGETEEAIWSALDAGIVDKSSNARKFAKAGCLTGKNSFVAGTEILLSDGSVKPIEEVAAGDEVLATDPESGETAAKTVTAKITTDEDKQYVEIEVAADSAVNGYSIITATDHHPFWSESERQWIDAGDLKAGMTLRTNSGNAAEVVGVRAYSARHVTYNLTVSDLHTYYVLAGSTPVLVHNENEGWTPSAATKVMQGGQFGATYYRMPPDRLGNVYWWSKDITGHGESKWKIFTETKKGLEWYRDADANGTYIVGKHKGDAGKSVLFSKLKSVNIKGLGC